MHRDYAAKGVKFYYIYKYLAHAGGKGYVQPFTLRERLLHLQEGKRTLGTQIPWICDTMTNDLKHALGDAPTSEFIIDPQGKVVRRRAWGNTSQLRKDLAELIGPVKNPTKIADLKLKTSPPAKVAARGIVPRIKRPSGMKPLSIEPDILKSTQPFYVKLRPQAERRLLRTGTGKLYLEFRLDPIYRVHWNNLTKPIRIELNLPGKTTATPKSAQGPKIKEPSDIDPREFLLDVKRIGTAAGPLQLTVRYFACNDEAGWCKSITQQYVIHRREDVEDGYFVQPMPHGAAWPAFRGPLTSKPPWDILRCPDHPGRAVCEAA